jgi:hypothetical protein
MPQSSTTFPPSDRIAARICRSVNAQGSTDAGPAIAALRQRSTATSVEAAIRVAIERGWLRRNGDAYTVTSSGVALGKSRSGKRTGRVMPF